MQRGRPEPLAGRRGPHVGRVVTPARILLVGGGGREHALAWRLGADPGVGRLIAAPGNPGLAELGAVRPDVRVDDTDALVDTARAERADLVVVGPEAPLVAGLADRLRAAGIPVFGPEAGAAAVEGSKAFCRTVAAESGIPMAEGAAFTALGPALEYADALGVPLVVKADGLAAGKGVTVCHTPDAAEEALRDALERRVFGPAGARVVVERALSGPEASVIALCDATTALALPAARDHKRIHDADRGPNTGGMGAYSPLPDLDGRAVEELVERIHRPALGALARRGIPFRGALYAGLMLTARGPRLLEFNARFGDPETQALLPLLDVPLAPLLLAAATDRLAEVAPALGIEGTLLPMRAGASVAVVLAASGYPSAPRTGDAIAGIEDARAEGALVFHAGTAHAVDGALVTGGGRVLSVVGEGPDLPAAAERAYRAAARISFAGCQYRRDIGRAVPAGVA